MKPITNILLVLALVCYAFFPFYDIKFQGGLNGLEFTAGVISRLESFKGLLFAITPFLAGFLAIGLNCLKSKRWSGLSLLPIIAVLFFFTLASDFHEFSLSHTPEVTPADDLGEGFAIEGLGWGFLSSCTLYILSLISAVMALMPFKFNDYIERAVDDTFDKGIEDIKHFGHGVRDEVRRLESRSHKHGKTATPPPVPPVDTPQEPTVDKEDDSRFMPK